MKNTYSGPKRQLDIVWVPFCVTWHCCSHEFRPSKGVVVGGDDREMVMVGRV
jgi:hypothetical protein